MVVKTIVLAPEPVSKARKNRRRYEGGAGEGAAAKRGPKKRDGGKQSSRIVLAFLVPRMKTIRGIFLTTRGHPGTAVSKDCELNERERDRRDGLSFFARSGALWTFHSFITLFIR